MQNTWKEKISRRPPFNKVRAFIYQCKELPSADEDGLADPFVQVWDNVDKDESNPQYKKTRTVNNTCDPMFYQVLDLDIEGQTVAQMPPFVFDIYDVDEGMVYGQSTSYICRAVIPVHEAAVKIIEDPNEEVFDDTKPPIPKWHPCKFKQDGEKTGEILVSFILI